MDITYFSIILFMMLTIIYYLFPVIGKISPTIENLATNESISEFKYTNYIRLGIYFMGIVVSQFIVNAVYIMNYCGGSNTSNYGSAFMITFVPWVFIFGIMLITITMFPGFKSAFSDIIGYFLVASNANTILNNILKEEKVENSKEPDLNVKNAASDLMKLFSNKAIIINQFVPDNFSSMWDILKPLMKDDADTHKSALLDMVVLRDNIGESVWYIYTALVVISIVSYKLSSRECEMIISDISKEGVKKQKS